MVETTENQICSSSSSSSSSSSFYVLKPYLLCVALVVITCIVLSSFLGFGFYPIFFTLSILILSTNFLVTFTKKMRKVVLVENPGSIKLQVEDEGVEGKLVMEPGAGQEADIGIVNEFQVEPLDLTTTESERSENVGELHLGKNMEQNPGISYDSASEDEEEGLIEIAIPSNDSNGSSEEYKSKSNSLPNFFLPESTLFKQQKQQDLGELLAEMNEANEEENLIEIDISMGSIK